MCFTPKIPKPQALPNPVNKLDTQVSALKRAQRSVFGGLTRSDTNVTGGSASGAPVYTPAAGGKLLLGA